MKVRNRSLAGDATGGSTTDSAFLQAASMRRIETLSLLWASQCIFKKISWKDPRVGTMTPRVRCSGYVKCHVSSFLLYARSRRSEREKDFVSHDLLRRLTNSTSFQCCLGGRHSCNKTDGFLYKFIELSVRHIQ